MSSKKEHPLLKKFENQNSNIDNSNLSSAKKEKEENLVPIKNRRQKILLSMKNFCEKQLSPNSFVTNLVTRWYDESQMPSLSKNYEVSRGPDAFYTSILASLLLIIVIFSWIYFPPMLDEIDQLKNDLHEQEQVMDIEKKNNDFLDRLEADNNELQRKIHIVDEAVPNNDERAEKMISDLALFADNYGIGLNAISINAIQDSQFYNDDLVGIVRPFEYNFSIENTLNNIYLLLKDIRSSLRIMDIMTISIEKSKGSYYKATVSLLAYDLIES